MDGSEPTGSGTGRRKRRNPLLERYKLVVPRWYSAWMHVVGLTGAAAAALALVWWRVGDVPVRPWVWSLFLLALVLANGLEYAVHRWPMHKRVKGLFERLFVRHTLFHHRFFTHETMAVENSKQMYLVFFEIELGIIAGILVLGVHMGLRAFVGADVPAVVATGLITYWLALELVHAMTHLPESWFTRYPLRLAPFRYLRDFHQVHHDPKLMRQHNFGVTFPLFDWLCGTSAGAKHPSERDAVVPDDSMLSA